MRVLFATFALVLLAACAEESAPHLALTLTSDQQLAFDWCVNDGESRGEPWAELQPRCHDLALRSGVNLRGAS